MKNIPLTRGAHTTISDTDFERVSVHKWMSTKSGYAIRNTPKKERGYSRKMIYMHRFILGAQAGQFVDHIDGNGLNNSRGNLRLTDATGNARNMRKQVNPNLSSSFKGVSYHSSAKKWEASIHAKNKKKYLGVFPTEKQAALAYNQAARELFGEFALLNEV